MWTFGKLKFATWPNKEGNFRSREHKKKALEFTLEILARDPLVESGWTGRGLLRFEDTYTKGMYGGLLNATKRDRPESMRKAAVHLLGSLRKPEAEKFLMDVLNDRAASTELKEMANEALVKIGKKQ